MCCIISHRDICSHKIESNQSQAARKPLKDETRPMWKKVKSLLTGQNPSPQTQIEGHPAQDRKVAVAAASLLAEAARVDGSFDPQERACIEKIARQHFGFDEKSLSILFYISNLSAPGSYKNTSLNTFAMNCRF